jgi:hypothetical protein
VIGRNEVITWSLPVDPAATDGAWGVPDWVKYGSAIRTTRIITIAEALTRANFFDDGIIFV